MFWLKAHCPTGGRAGWSNRYILSQFAKRASPRVVLHSFFMADWSGTGHTVGPNGPNSRTLLRRLQRKHSQQCYVQMRNKLISLVKPIPPTALHASNLEAFRAKLYTNDCEGILPQLPKDDVTEQVLQACNWCGTWMPLPRQATIAISKGNCTEASEDTAAERQEPELEETGEDYSECVDLGINNIGIQPEISNRLLEIQGLLDKDAPLVCEAVSLLWGDKAREKPTRAQSFNALPWLPSLHVSKGQYSTDPNTGECKTQ